MMPITVLLCALAVVGAAAAISGFRRRRVGKAALAAWVGVWASVACVAIWPDFTAAVSAKLGVGRGSDLVIYIAVVVLLYSVFRLSLGIKRAEHNITRLVRHIAISDASTDRSPQGEPR